MFSGFNQILKTMSFRYAIAEWIHIRLHYCDSRFKFFFISDIDTILVTYKNENKPKRGPFATISAFYKLKFILIEILNFDNFL